MQKKNYQNFNDENTGDEIAVGIPINLTELQNMAGQHLQFQPQQPQSLNIQNPQGYLPNHQIPFNQPQVPHQFPPAFQANAVIDYSKSFSIRCPCCTSQINTIVNSEAGNATYLWAGVIFCCVSPFCSCIPFMTDKCADKNHYCPQCGFNILRKHRGYFDCD